MALTYVSIKTNDFESSHVLIGHVYTFFEDTFIQILCLYFNCRVLLSLYVFNFVLLSCKNSPFVLDIRLLSNACKHFLPI